MAVEGANAGAAPDEPKAFEPAVVEVVLERPLETPVERPADEPKDEPVEVAVRGVWARLLTCAKTGPGVRI